MTAASTSSGDREHEDVAEALAPEAAQRAAQLLQLLPDDVRAEVAVRPRAVALLAELLRAGRGRSRPAGSGTRRPARPAACAPPAGRSSRRRPSAGRAASRLRRDEVQHLEGVVGRRLVVLVVGHQAAAEVGREHLGRLEVLAGRTWTCPSPTAPIRTTRESSGIDLHRVVMRRNTAICVGAPSVGDRLRADGHEAHRVPVAELADPPRPRLRTRPGSTRSGGRGGGTCRRAASRTCTLYSSVRRRHDDRRRAARTRTARARTRPAGAGRGAR